MDTCWWMQECRRVGEACECREVHCFDAAALPASIHPSIHPSVHPLRNRTSGVSSTSDSPTADLNMNTWPISCATSLPAGVGGVGGHGADGL